MSRPDLETLEDDLIQIIEENLPAKLIEINAEKSDGITTENVARENWYDSPTDEVFNRNIYAVYGFDSITGLSPGRKAATIKWTFEIALTDEQDTKAGRRKAMRYARALKEIFELNAFRFSYLSAFEIQIFAPVGIQDIKGTKLKVSGIQITTTMV